MNRFYNHIKHLADNIAVLKSNKRPWEAIFLEDPKHQANHLDDKQRRSGFDYYE